MCFFEFLIHIDHKPLNKQESFLGNVNVTVLFIPSEVENVLRGSRLISIY